MTGAIDPVRIEGLRKDLAIGGDNQTGEGMIALRARFSRQRDRALHPAGVVLH